MGSTCLGASLAQNASCTVSVRFNPSSAGSKSATLSLDHNGSVSPSVVTLSGIGLAPVASPSTTELDFGQVVMGDTSDPETVTLTNTGTANLVIGTTSLSGPDSDSFEVTDDDCAGTTVAPGSSCDIDVTFTAGDSGAATASLSITHNTTDSPTVIALTGISTPTSDIKILGIGSVYTGHDHLVTRTVPSSGTLMKYKVGIVNEDTVAHTYKFRLTSRAQPRPHRSGRPASPPRCCPPTAPATSSPAPSCPARPSSTSSGSRRPLPDRSPRRRRRPPVVDGRPDRGGVDPDQHRGSAQRHQWVRALRHPGLPAPDRRPGDGQTVTSPALNVGQSTTFKVRLKNNSATGKQIGLRLTQIDGCAGSFTVTVKAGTLVITTAAFAGTYLTPILAPASTRTSSSRVSALPPAVATSSSAPSPSTAALRSDVEPGDQRFLQRRLD